jgi:predicted AAA+ superfamily ATPase
MIEAYCNHFGLDIESAQLRAEAKEWAVTRGSRSGRVAWQFVQEVAGRMGKTLDLNG